MTMTMDPATAAKELDRFCNELLSLVELREAGLLNWGFFDVRSDLDHELESILDGLPEVLAAQWDALQVAGYTPRDLLDNLRVRRLIFFKGGRYRTRFAETIRLLALLRQRFNDQDWNTASRLVSDLRIDLRRRRYPRRDISAEDAIEAVAREWGSGTRQVAALRELLHDNGQPLILAAFQRDAMSAMARMLTVRGDHALVIGAGTGAGKTKAFYVPAMAEIAATLGDRRWVQALALYPRIELLKDQLTEAYTEARKLDGFLEGDRRPVALGAYYGAIPRSAEALLRQNDLYRNRLSSQWQPSTRLDGWVCPFFSCPDPNCAGEMVWQRADVEREVKANKQHRFGEYARLRCAICGAETDGTQLILTRNHLQRQPPDILFTTTEMLNRRLSNAWEHALFGVHTSSPPKLLLLDEIHTHEGLTGAQVAYLLRRWRHARGRHPERPLTIVGLSATLTQAEEFFANLTSIPHHAVRYITPAADDLLDEGMEYNVVLKGDPVSGTSLLSTSVQTAMLLARALDPLSGHGANVSRRAFGQKVFAFTDKLDVLNRWFHIELNAEQHRRLSQYRRTDRGLTQVERLLRRQEGQEWWLSEEIGHDLEFPLNIDLVSSQHQGIDPKAQLVIATSSLEVGFNDPAVGAVIQHKAPRSMASFLQRKGRAGRTRAMRPWTVVVTSAYGRDRWAFQHAESLFDPSLPPLDLPIDNYYVRKIQAAFALLDWLAVQLARSGQRVDLWDALASDSDWRRRQQLDAPRRAIIGLLQEVLSGSLEDDLTSYLRQALGLRDDEASVQAVLWDQPRSLLLDVIPTLLRRLETNWQAVSNGTAQPWSDQVSSLPLPDYAPANLFSDLNLPELLLRVPSARRGDDQILREETLALETGIVEYAPGHVSKRYSGRDRVREAHWIPLPAEHETPDGKLALEQLSIQTDDVPITIDVLDTTYHVFRPRTYTLELLPNNVKNSSSARLDWRSRLDPASNDNVPAQDGLPLELAAGSEWRRLLSDVHAFTHERGSLVNVARIATGISAVTRYEPNLEERRTLTFTRDKQPAALGFALEVDALRFRFQPLDVDALLRHPRWPTVYRGLGPRYFLDCLRADRRLIDAGLTEFEISWLWQLHLSMLVAVAIAERRDLSDAAERVAANPGPLVKRTLDAIFQSLPSDAIDEDEQTGRLQARLLDVVELPEVQSTLRTWERVLWDSEDIGLPEWLRAVYASSLGASLFTALTQLVPDLDDEELRLDVDAQSLEVWISEAAGGGVGLVARIAEDIARYPRHLDLQLLDTIQNCDRELLAGQLRAVADLVGSKDDALVSSFEAVRQSGDLPRQEMLRRTLASALEEQGIPATRELMVALHAKFLRPNSGSDSDALIAALAARWEDEEERLGCAIDLRVLAVAAARQEDIAENVRAVLSRIGGTEATITTAQVANLLQSLLWLDCHDACPDCIELWQPYQTLTQPSRALLQLLVEPEAEPIVFGTDGWTMLVREQLSAQLIVRVACRQAELSACKQGLLELLVEPVDVGYQLYFPTVDRIVRDRRNWTITLTVAELVQE